MQIDINAANEARALMAQYSCPLGATKVIRDGVVYCIGKSGTTPAKRVSTGGGPNLSLDRDGLPTVTIFPGSGLKNLLTDTVSRIRNEHTFATDAPESSESEDSEARQDANKTPPSGGGGGGGGGAGGSGSSEPVSDSTKQTILSVVLGVIAFRIFGG